MELRRVNSNGSTCITSLKGRSVYRLRRLMRPRQAPRTMDDAYAAFRTEGLENVFFYTAVLGAIIMILLSTYSFFNGSMFHILDHPTGFAGATHYLELSGWLDLSRILVMGLTLFINGMQPQLNPRWPVDVSLWCLATSLLLICCVVVDSEVYLSIMGTSFALEETRLLAHGGRLTYWDEKVICSSATPNGSCEASSPGSRHIFDIQGVGACSNETALQLLTACGERDQCSCRMNEKYIVYGFIGVWTFAAIPSRILPTHFFVLIVFTLVLHAVCCGLSLSTVASDCVISACFDLGLGLLMLLGVYRAEKMRRDSFKRRWQRAAEIEMSKLQQEGFIAEKQMLMAIDSAFDLISTRRSLPASSSRNSRTSFMSERHSPSSRSPSSRHASSSPGLRALEYVGSMNWGKLDRNQKRSKERSPAGQRSNGTKTRVPVTVVASSAPAQIDSSAANLPTARLVHNVMGPPEESLPPAESLQQTESSSRSSLSIPEAQKISSTDGVSSSEGAPAPEAALTSEIVPWSEGETPTLDMPPKMMSQPRTVSLSESQQLPKIYARVGFSADDKPCGKIRAKLHGLKSADASPKSPMSEPARRRQIEVVRQRSCSNIFREAWQKRKTNFQFHEAHSTGKMHAHHAHNLVLKWRKHKDKSSASNEDFPRILDKKRLSGRIRVPLVPTAPFRLAAPDALPSLQLDPCPRAEDMQSESEEEMQCAGSAIRGIMKRILLSSTMEGQPWPTIEMRKERLMAICNSLLEPEYKLKDYFADCRVCFPELMLYMLEPAADSPEDAGKASTSGLSADEEYRRTLGALFAIFWLVRIDTNLPSASSSARGEDPYSRASDGLREESRGSGHREDTSASGPMTHSFNSLSSAAGAEVADAVRATQTLPTRCLGEGPRGFCFGVDSEEWEPISIRQVTNLAVELASAALQPATADSLKERSEMQKRLQFMKTMDWSRLRGLLINSGVLRVNPTTNALEVDADRMQAMLVLTAIHDVMKLTHLLPVVLEEHAPFGGHKAGDVIRDHDLALSYVMKYDPESLPSYSTLTEEQRRAVCFTQADLGFNHGWLVQAEAPPGMLFHTFKKLVDAGGTSSADIAFYFVHWLTDLAGAEPTPLRGSEKFVVRFPQPVLEGIIKSMPVVQMLANTSPTALFESFLEQAWHDAKHLGPLPVGDESIALMRLIVQVQEPAKQLRVRDAFLALQPEQRSILAEEMALSTQAGVAYSRSPSVRGGPGFLVYYSPAFLRNCCAGAAGRGSHIGLVALSEVYRAARRFWPRSSEKEAEGVTVYVDELKSCASVDDMLAVYSDGCCWVLVRENDSSAIVRRCQIEKLPVQLAKKDCEILRLWSTAVHDGRHVKLSDEVVVSY